MKERLTITLDKSLLSSIDATIDGVSIRNRSHAIEQLLTTAISRGRPKKAVIFAGGTPVAVDGKSTPVSMVMIKGRPIIDYIVDELRRNHISEIIITISKDSEGIFNYLGDGSSKGVAITYIKEETPRGTEGVIESVKGKIGNEPFFALNGDHIFSIDMADMYAQHMANKAIATVALTPADSRSRFGVTNLAGNRITSFIQKHEQGSSAALVNAGIYLFNPEVFDLVGQVHGRVMIEERLFPKLVGMGKLFGYVFSGPWYSLDSTSSIQKSIKELENIASN